MNEVILIPGEWRTNVCRLLDLGRARVPCSVFERWEEMFQDNITTIEMLYARVSEALQDDGIRGVKVLTMHNEPGEVYEFLFPLHDVHEKAYAKVSLRLANNEVYILFAS